MVKNPNRFRVEKSKRKFEKIEEEKERASCKFLFRVSSKSESWRTHEWSTSGSWRRINQYTVVAVG